MFTLGVILARAGSKGLPNKCVLPLCGRPIVAYSISHAQQSSYLDDTVLTTDSQPAMAIARQMGASVIQRPPALADDEARVDHAVRHAVLEYERAEQVRVDAVVVLYGNIPVRADGIIDQCVDLLIRTGCDSVRTVTAVSKQHPDWVHRLEAEGKMVQFRPNSIHRRQELEPLYYHDGAVVAVRRETLLAAAAGDDPHAFFGTDRRAVVQDEQDTVDIDTAVDFYRAEAIIRAASESIFLEKPTAGSRKPPFTAAVSHAGVSPRY